METVNMQNNKGTEMCPIFIQKMEGDFNILEYQLQPLLFNTIPRAGVLHCPCKALRGPLSAFRVLGI